MAASQAVKCLDLSSGRRRFVFKPFAQRVGEIEIDVFRSIDHVKAEPSEGSSFFRDCLLEWRELNTAEDFISFYEQTMPLVQTLPQIFLHRERIFSELLRRVNMAAKLSLEPILRLISSLSRDILEEFLPFLQRLVNSFLVMLHEGGERDPEVLEQVFMTFSCIVMYLQKYLIKDVVNIIEITASLRYYPKSFVQEFMAESVSFILRSAPKSQLLAGVRRVFCEATENFSEEKKTGASALLWHTMRGASSRLHSKSEIVLRLLTDRSILGMKCDASEDVALEIVTETFHRLCKVLEPAELNLPWNCILEEVQSSILDEHLLHLNRLLSVLISVVQFRRGAKICDRLSISKLVKLLIETYVTPTNGTSETANKVLMLILYLLDAHDVAGELSPTSRIVLEWAPIFKIQDSRLLGFIKEIVCKEPNVVNAFKTQIMSALDYLVVSSTEEVICLLMMLFEREEKLHFCDDLLREAYAGIPNISRFIEERIYYWFKTITDVVESQRSGLEVCESDLAVLWGILIIYPHFCHLHQNPSCIADLLDPLTHLLSTETDSIIGISKTKWQSVAGALLVSYQHLLDVHRAAHLELNKILKIASENNSSPLVLSAAADILDSFARQVDGKDLFHEFAEFNIDHTANLIKIFEENLVRPHKVLRTSSLRILSHFPCLGLPPSTEDECPSKKMKIEGSEYSFVGSQDASVTMLLLLVETTPLTVSASRKITLLISRIQMSISVERISEAHISVLFSGLIGILHNRFNHLWPPVIECLMIMISKHKDLVWGRFVQCFENVQLAFLSSGSQEDRSISDHSKPNGLDDHFNLSLAVHSDSTPLGTMVCLLLQTLQRVPAIAESRSRQIVPLFLKFLGYDGDVTLREEIFNSSTVNRKEWKSVLKEWLNLLRLLHNARSLFQSQLLKNVLTNRLIGDTDSEIQSKVLDCLLNWKDDYLLPYSQHLRNLINAKSLREELTIWVLSKDSLNVEEMHRCFLIPIVIRILVPKVRKLKTLASRKLASINHRRAILCFLTQLDVNELPLFFSLLIKNLFLNTDGSKAYVADSESSLEKCLALPLSFLQTGSVLLKSLSLKKKFGFLHVVEDILRSFDDFHIKPFLDLLLVVVVKILENCTDNITNNQGSHCTVNSEAINLKLLEVHWQPTTAQPVILLAVLGSCGMISSRVVLDLLANIVSYHTDMPDHAQRKRTKSENDWKRSKQEAKDLRSLCLKIFCFALNNYECGSLYPQIWDAFFTSVKPLMDSFKNDVSGSENPSLLLLCFIAMGKNPCFISLLDKFLPTIFSILTEKTASETVVSSVFSFIENILILDGEMEHQDDSVKKVLMPHLKELFSCIHQFFHHRKESQRKVLMWPGMKQIKILKLLGRYVNETVVARDFLDIMLPLFMKKDLNSDECLEGLHVIKGMLLLLDGEASTKVVNMTSVLLVSAMVNVRLLICDILEGLSKINPSLTFLAKLLRDLNAVSATELDELDYDTRISAYEVLDAKLFATLNEDFASVVLSQCIYDLSSDLILRQSASRALASFIQFSSLFLNSEMKSHEGMLSDGLLSDVPIEAGVGTAGINPWNRKQIQKIVKKTFLQNMGETMNKEISVQQLLNAEVDTSIQKEWIILFREMVCKLPGVPALCSVRLLCSDDAEVDFFSNILHLQTHRRVKALSHFRSIVDTGKLSEDMNEKIFIPLFFTMLFEVKGGKGEHIRNACIESIASISGQLSWKAYKTLLIRVMRYIRKMDSKPDKQKFLLRLMICVLDKFHFYNMDFSHMPHNEGESLHTDVPQVIKNSKTNVPDPQVIQHSLQKMVLPQIQKLLGVDSDRINANMSLAALKVLKLLPKEIMESQIPSIIHRISNFLKSRLESMRDEARSVLAACLKELGLSYLGFIIKVLQSTLKRGYEMHVLGHSVNFILLKSLPVPKIGALDPCLEELFSIVENDILGNVSEEKEVGKIASKMKETRKSKSFETLKMVSQNITFRTHASKLLIPIEKQLQNHVTVKVKTKLEMMLSYIASGIETNPSVHQKELFIFVYGLLEDGVASDRPSSNAVSRMMDGNDVSVRDDTLCGNSTRLCSSHLILVFALGLLYNRLRNMKLNKKDEELLSMLDPFVELLGTCLRSKYESVLSGAFKCLILLVRLPLPSLEVHSDNVKALLLDIAQKSGNTRSPLVQSCLKLLTALLQSTNISLSNEQLHALIQFPLFIDIQANPSHVALSLLKAIVTRKLVVHEIYDLVTQVAELMVTSQVDSVRKKCSQILLQFLLDYRLSNKRLEQHLDFLLRNLSYEHSSGREAVLEMFHAILVKFPVSVVETHAQSWFLALVVALVKDSDKNVQSMVATVIKMLLSRISQHAIYPILDYSISWYQGENQDLWGVAAQVLCLMVDVLKRGFRKYTDNILPVAKRIMETSLCMTVSKDVGDAVPLWKEAYHTLAMLEKMVCQYPELYSDSYKDLWNVICKFLLHPHARLRSISNRILASYFSAAGSKSGITTDDKVNMEISLLLDHHRIFLLAVSFCNQLKSRLMDDITNKVITYNLVFSICGVHSFAKQKGSTPVHMFWSSLTNDEQGSYLEAFDLLGSRKNREAFLLHTSSEVPEVLNTETNVQTLLVVPLINKIGKLALTRGDVQMKVAFNCFRMITSQIGPESSRDYAIHMLLPLYRVCEGFAGKLIPDENKELAAEVRDSIKGVMGVDHFVKAYNQARKISKEKRDKRRRGEKLMAVINPMRHAKRKLRISAKHSAHKRRKMAAMKMGRWKR